MGCGQKIEIGISGREGNVDGVDFSVAENFVVAGIVCHFDSFDMMEAVLELRHEVLIRLCVRRATCRRCR